jgi:hypothetical protein
MKRMRRPASGRFLLRLTPGLHSMLRSAARDAGSSLNDYCARKLAAPGASLDALPGAAAVVERAAELFGADLVGVIAFGSWTRGEAMTRSDVDVLVVVERSAPIRRDLYRRWDVQPLRLEGREIEPHFVRLSSSDEPATGLWAEAAIDGLILFERGARLSRRLGEVRRAIVAGRLIRRLAHGQPYWTEVA